MSAFTPELRLHIDINSSLAKTAKESEVSLAVKPVLFTNHFPI